jgi:hypothetical protein
VLEKGTVRYQGTVAAFRGGIRPHQLPRPVGEHHGHSVCHLPTQGRSPTARHSSPSAGAAESRRIASLWVSDHVIFPRHVPPGYPAAAFPILPIAVP